MLSVCHDGSGPARRDFLKIGTLGLGGLSLPWLLEAQARAAGSDRAVTGKSVIFSKSGEVRSLRSAFSASSTAPSPSSSPIMRASSTVRCGCGPVGAEGTPAV